MANNLVATMQLDDIVNIADFIDKTYKNKYAFTGSLSISLYSAIIKTPFRNIDDIDVFIFDQKKEKVTIYFYDYKTQTKRKPMLHELKSENELVIDISEKFNHDFLEPNIQDTIAVHIKNETIRILKPEYVLCSKLFKKRALREKDKFDIKFIINNISLDLNYLEQVINKLTFYKNLLKKFSIDDLSNKIKSDEIYTIIERELDKKYNLSQIIDIRPEEKNTLLNLSYPKNYKTLFETIFYNINPRATSEIAVNIKKIIIENNRNNSQNRSSFYLYSSRLYKKKQSLQQIEKLTKSKKPIVFYFKQFNLE